MCVMDEDLRALANSVIWPGFLGTSAPEWLLDELRHGLAGAVYFANNLSDPEQLTALSSRLREANPSALIGLDEEGGTVTRLHSRAGSTIPGAGLLGAIDEPELTARASSLIAAECRAVGVNVVIGPVADVNVNPANPVIGVRSFGADPATVSAHVAAAVTAFNAAPIACCVKHFPGHGDTSADSHLALPVSGADADTQQRVHLAPFRAAVDAGAPSMMSAHVVLPHLGAEPVTLNPRALEPLRDSESGGLGFDGVVISDALDMAAIAATHGIGPGGVLALSAGCDLLCVGNPANTDDPGLDRRQFTELQRAIVTALADGSLPRARVEEAAGRVRRLAETFPLDPAVIPESPSRKESGPDTGHFDTDHFDSGLLAAVRALLRAQGVTPLAGSRPVEVVDLRHRTNQAAGASADRFAGALEAAGARCEYRRVRPTDELPGAPTDQRVALVDDLSGGGWQRSAALSLTPTVIVNAGVAPTDDLTAPVLNCFESSKISARAAASTLLP